MESSAQPASTTGTWLRQARRRLGITQEGLAQRIADISDGAVRYESAKRNVERWESGTAPRGANLMLLARALGEDPPEELVTMSDVAMALTLLDRQAKALSDTQRRTQSLVEVVGVNLEALEAREEAGAAETTERPNLAASLEGLLAEVERLAAGLAEVQEHLEKLESAKATRQSDRGQKRPKRAAQ